METSTRKSQLYWFIQATSLVLLSLLVYEKSYAVESHSYLAHGGQFHLLADATFGTKEVAKIRVEYTAVDPQIGGMDIALYKIKDPLAFLKSQRNLHNVSTNYEYSPAGVVANSMRYVWDKFNYKSRLIWQRLTDEKVRSKVVDKEPRFSQSSVPKKTEYKQYAQFKPIKGFELIDSFRYPISLAANVAQPVDKLAGSSSFFSSMNHKLNVYVPFGKLNAGVYLVEATLGTHRANSLLFVSDTVVVSKMSSKNLFAWSVDKTSGKASGETTILLSDGVGVLKQVKTGPQGFVSIDTKIPEQSYLIVIDRNGGVSISENFYYESEIYNSKIYVFTDRPLYQPGDTVYLKVIGREFQSSSKSSQLTKTDFEVIVLDASSTVLLNEKMSYHPQKGGELDFKLPINALPGGHSILLKSRGKTYASEFRVAKYAKPYFNLEILTTPHRLELNKEASSRVVLSYFNGEPVKNAKVELIIRRQKLNVIEGDHDAESLFPINVNQFEAKTNEMGVAEFKLPPVTEASRYIIIAKATDSSQFTVSTQVEVSHSEAKPVYRVKNSNSFSKPGETVTFTLTDNGQSYSSVDKKVVRWTAIRIDDQSVVEGSVEKLSVGIKFNKAGTYRINFLNGNGVSLGRINQVVVGTQLKLASGSIDISTDKVDYSPGERASFVVTTEEEVDEILVTLERDKVEEFSLGSEAKDWLKVTKLSSTQWLANLEVKNDYAPNMVLSVLYVKNGQMSFSNKGFKVLKPKILVSYDFDKASYRPRDRLKVKIKTTYLGKAIQSRLVLSVVDEMIYVLQPEIAPSIEDFFFHVRRNQVKTSSTLSFFGYDSSESVDPSREIPQSGYEERPMKLRERPRREDVDTAMFKTFETNSEGEVIVDLSLPDSITKWRFTARAFSESGIVGQAVEKVLTSQNVYTKWGSHTVFREGDSGNSALIVFNTTSKSVDAKYSIVGAGEKISGNTRLLPGVNFVSYAFKPTQSDIVKIKVEGEHSDHLSRSIDVIPPQWLAFRAEMLSLVAGENPIKFHSETFNHYIKNASDDYLNFMNHVEQLVSYPNGCVEQTASKLLALTLAYKIVSASKDSRRISDLRRMIVNGREHLISMANQGANFGWYEGMSNNSFMSLYAYLADMYATKAIGVRFDERSVAKVVNSYRGAANNNVLKESLMLWMGAQMDQPVQGLLVSMLDEIENKKKKVKVSSSQTKFHNYIMSESHREPHYQLASLLVGLAAQKMQENKQVFAKGELDKINKTVKQIAEKVSGQSNSLVSIAAAAYLKKNLSVGSYLDDNEYNDSTIDRALKLILISQHLDEKNQITDAKISGDNWVAFTDRLGTGGIRYSGKPTAKSSLKSDKPLKVLHNYSTYKADKHSEGVEIKTTLYEFIEGEQLKAKKVENPKRLVAAKIYLLKVDLDFSDHSNYGFLELALPPGGQVEKGLAGVEIDITDGKVTCASHFDENILSVGVPIESASSKMVVLVPVRFGAKGSFVLPRTRFYRMYGESEKSYENKNNPSVVTVEVI